MPHRPAQTGFPFLRPDVSAESAQTPVQSLHSGQPLHMAPDPARQHRSGRARQLASSRPAAMCWQDGQAVTRCLSDLTMLMLHGRHRACGRGLRVSGRADCITGHPEQSHLPPRCPRNASGLSTIIGSQIGDWLHGNNCGPVVRPTRTRRLAERLLSANTACRGQTLHYRLG